MNEDIKDIIEILELSKEEIENNDENITATLDLQDLKSLKKLYELYQEEKEKNINLTQELEKRKWVKIKENGEVEPAFFISKDKIIKLLNKYDKASFIAKVDLQELLEERK